MEKLSRLEKNLNLKEKELEEVMFNDMFRLNLSAFLTASAWPPLAIFISARRTSVTARKRVGTTICC